MQACRSGHISCMISLDVLIDIEIGPYGCSTLMPGVTRWYSRELTNLCGRSVMTVHQPEFLRAATALADAMRPFCVVIGLESRLPLVDGLPKLPKELLPLYKLAKLFVPGKLSSDCCLHAIAFDVALAHGSVVISVINGAGV